MDRDIQFEVQFLLSTIVVVLGVVGITNSEKYVTEYVGVAFVIISTLHLLLLISYYAFNQIPKPRSPYLDSLKNWSENTLFIVSLAFIYFVFHVLVKAPPNYLGELIVENSSVESPETVTKYLNLLLPSIPTIIMGGAFWAVGLPTFRLARDLSTNIVPETVKVYRDYSSQRTPLMLEITNDGDEGFDVELGMELPEGIAAKDVRKDDEYVDEEFSQELTIDGDSRAELQLLFRHDRDRRETASVNFEVSHTNGVLEESTVLYLR